MAEHVNSSAATFDNLGNSSNESLYWISRLAQGVKSQ